MRLLIPALALAGAMSSAALAQTAPATTPAAPPSTPAPAATPATPKAAAVVAPPPKGPDSNAAVAVNSNHEAAQPAHGRNSFTHNQAAARLKKHGYANVTGLKKDSDGVWRGSASKDGAQVPVWLDYKGNVGQQ